MSSQDDGVGSDRIDLVFEVFVIVSQSLLPFKRKITNRMQEKKKKTKKKKL